LERQRRESGIALNSIGFDAFYLANQVIFLLTFENLLKTSNHPKGILGVSGKLEVDPGLRLLIL
jgi:hypothetical protein